MLSAIILFGGLQGLLLAFALMRLKEGEHTTNRLLSAFLLLISLVLFSRLVYVEGIDIWQKYPHLFLLPDIPMFLYGPLFYLYIRRLLGKNKLTAWRLGVHFIPALAHFSVLAFYLV